MDNVVTSHLCRDPGAPNALSLYTNPSFFFDLWRQEMLKVKVLEDDDNSFFNIMHLPYACWLKGLCGQYWTEKDQVSTAGWPRCGEESEEAAATSATAAAGSSQAASSEVWNWSMIRFKATKCSTARSGICLRFEIRGRRLRSHSPMSTRHHKLWVYSFIRRIRSSMFRLVVWISSSFRFECSENVELWRKNYCVGGTWPIDQLLLSGEGPLFSRFPALLLMLLFH